MYKYAPFITTLAYAHTPVNTSTLVAAGHPASYEFIAALGEAYHNAWMDCADRTTNWLLDDLDVASEDPAFDNGYYVEYDILDRVPATYGMFQELLGEESYWPKPEFTGDGARVAHQANLNSSMA